MSKDGSVTYHAEIVYLYQNQRSSMFFRRRASSLEEFCIRAENFVEEWARDFPEQIPELTAIWMTYDD